MVQFRYFIRHLFASHVAHDIIDLKLVRHFFCISDSLSGSPLHSALGSSGKLSLLLASTCVRTMCNKYVASNFEIKKNISIYCRLQLRSWLNGCPTRLAAPSFSLCQPTGQLPLLPPLLLLVNRLWDRLQLQLHHKSFSSSLQVASPHFSSRTCHMLPNVEISPLFLSCSLLVPLHIPNKLRSSRLYPTQPPVPVPSRSACNAYDAFPLPRHVPLPSQFLDLWPSFEYNYVVSEIFER